MRWNAVEGDIGRREQPSLKQPANASAEGSETLEAMIAYN
jgi:hypothetical protein